MKKLHTLITFAGLLLCSCQGNKTASPQVPIDTLPVIVMQIQQCNRLYTTEAQVHKIVTHSDEKRLKGTLFHKTFDIHMPGSDRKVAIPIDATIKAYIDFSDFSEKNIRREGKQIEILLPDPKFVLTNTKIDHERVKQYISLTRSNFSDAELSKLEQEGRQSIIKDIPHMGILQKAQISAANILIPMLKEMGYEEADIKVVFRKSYTIEDLKTLIDGNGVEQPRQID